MQCQEGCPWHREKGRGDQVKKAKKRGFRLWKCDFLVDTFM